ncbi:MAG: type II toxin-antitoxin system HicA family toxin [Prevotella sp.]|jgi:mRNA interferase HicA
MQNSWLLILNFVSLYCDNQKGNKMKYNELEKRLKKAGCYDTGEEIAGHPQWINPKTGIKFAMSHHHSREVATGTLNQILRAAGLK